MNIISIDTPVTVKGFTIVPVVKLSTEYSIKGGIAVFVTKQPVATAIRSSFGEKAFRVTGEQISLQQLFDEFPEIKDKLETII